MKTHNSLIIRQMGGGKFALRILILIIVCAACSACNPKPKPADDGFVHVPASLFWNRDSVMFYAERAFLQDDPKGCFVVGACYYLRQQGELPDYITIVDQAMADDMLMVSAGNGYQPAIDLIRCLQKNNCWKH